MTNLRFATSSIRSPVASCHDWKDIRQDSERVLSVKYGMKPLEANRGEFTKEREISHENFVQETKYKDDAKKLKNLGIIKILCKVYQRRGVLICT